MANQLSHDESLGADGFIQSSNGQYTFVYQGDGNLVLYKNYSNGTRKALWSSGTNGRSVGICIMQGDGNLVIYGPGGNYIWDSSTDGNANSRLVAQDDGNVVIYRPDDVPIWATNTVQQNMPSGPNAQGDVMQPGEVLNPNQAINSTNGRYTLVYQGDGNLVLYKNYPNGNRKWLWDSSTDGRPAGVCIMQGDGNLVIYGLDGEYIWDTSTDGNANSRLIVQDDGNIVIYRPDNVPIWATNTVQQNIPSGPTAQGDVMQPGEILNPNQAINSTSGRYTFVYQGDGNLVLYKNYSNGTRKALWSSGTNGRSVGICIMQGDGNLVIYGPDGEYIWDTSTDGSVNSRLVVQDDGNIVIYKPDGTPIWASYTVQQNLPSGPTAQGDVMRPGEVLYPNQSINSSNGRYTLVYQGDGNLVLYKNYRNGNRKWLWDSSTDGRPAGVCIMQGDGNLVIYGLDGEYIWDTSTDGNANSLLILQDDGNVTIRKLGNAIIWETNTKWMYSSEIRVSSFGNAPDVSNLLLKSWDLLTRIGNDRLRRTQIEKETVTIPLDFGSWTEFGFVSGPNPFNEIDYIGISAHLEGFPGPLFRSGQLKSLPEGDHNNHFDGLIDVLVIEEKRISISEINKQYKDEIEKSNGNYNIQGYKITSIVIDQIPQTKNLLLTVTGPYGKTTFKFTVIFTVTPSDYQFDLDSIIDVNLVGTTGKIVFIPGPGGGFEAFWLNAFSGLATGVITTKVIQGIYKGINETAKERASLEFKNAGLGDTIPSGLILNMPKVDVDNGDIVIIAAISCFGSILGKIVKGE